MSKHNNDLKARIKTLFSKDKPKEEVDLLEPDEIQENSLPNKNGLLLKKESKKIASDGRYLLKD